MKTSCQVFRHELLETRRKMLGMSQVMLAKTAGISQAAVSKIEQGIQLPSKEHVQRFSDALSCPISFFFQADRVYGAPVSMHPVFRKSVSVRQKEMDKLLATLNLRIAHIRTFLNAAEFTPELPLPRYELSEYGGDIEKIADSVRRSWFAPRGPIIPLAEYAERAGCIVSVCDMGGANIDGVSYNIIDMPPIVFLNKRQPADRMRFTLAHELGHLVLGHVVPSERMEEEANCFASALLMPKADIANDLSNLTLDKAAKLKPYWRVSIASILMRAKSLQKITSAQSNCLWRKMSMLGYRTCEPPELDFEQEKTEMVSGYVKYFLNELAYSSEDISHAFCLYKQEFLEMYECQPRLKLIKP